MSSTARRAASNFGNLPSSRSTKSYSATMRNTARTNYNADLEMKRIKTTSHINAEFSERSARAKTSYKKVPTRISNLNIRDIVQPFKEEPKDVVEKEEKNETEVVNSSIFLTFDLLKAMTPKRCINYLTQTPIFLRTMFMEGYLDSEIVSSVALSLTQSELQKFMINMTQELNFYSAIQTCQTIPELEAHIPKLISMQRITIWTKMDNSNYLTSQTLKAVLPLDQSCVGVPFLHKDDYNTGDPGNFQNFSISNDLPLLRGVKSMLLLPITFFDDEVVAVLQCVGLKNPITEEQMEFTPYYFEVFKIVRDLIQKRFFSVPTYRVVPSNVSNIFSEVETSSVSHTAKMISKFFTMTIPCEQCDLFEFDDRYRCLIRLSDGERFGEVEGGVSFQAGISPSIVNVPHGQVHEKLSEVLDGKFANRSILSRSLQQGRAHYVITLRAKPNAPSFSNQDSKLVSEMTPLICDALKLATFLQDQKNEKKEIQHERDILDAAIDTISAISTTGVDKYTALLGTAKKLFGCTEMFICIFDGRYMRYFPTDVKCKFEDCAAGQAYNYRETVWTRANDTKQRYLPQLYDQLKVKRETSICFPYRANGRVVGSIEMINPTRMELDKSEEKIFGNMCGAVVHETYAAKIQ
ncbi:hypothetical protein TVAG_384400 [Trichomonas vaginalis G3]|uniref:GAF domain containing protein n=1 Tax=Trichomonas vaginalis (strain ATCC PRA-98 / G3) TaxID=412133 RepID=A2FTP4_TRIV3|nr:oxygen sensor histidine kinase response regulator DevS/DosS family [Trichomonas vaginalis G3]EAX91716.1 hypothetical protein TVAG_384400 [Trichomonas vaginalis G3]KAI5524618.1 oxygen sensor histidine kinase response regulator DevS/DosS family [Trichomonas vaginalis G3]|eukprot:XP_001304646.1 hypothetical protein [Trichomonas vaginalis G3]